MAFWSTPGGPTFLDETVGRLSPMTPPDRTVVVVDQAHRRHVNALWGPARSSRFLFLPRNRGTATGILYGLAAIGEADADSIVVISRADHGVRDGELFLDGIERASSAVRSGEAAIVLCGIEPESASGDHGWILPCRSITARARPVQPVRAFVEKPWPKQASRLFAEGGLWNTAVVVARVQAVLELLKRYQPELCDFFRVHAMMPRTMRGRYVADHFPRLPTADFWRDVVTRGAHLTSVFTWPAALGWSDLASVDRLDLWLGGNGMRELAS